VNVKLGYTGVPGNEPRLRNAFADAAEGLGGDADIGGEVFAGNELNELGIICQQAEISLFGRILQEGHLPFVLLYIQFFRCESSEQIACRRSPVEFLQVIPGNAPHSGVRQCFRIITNWCTGKEGIVGGGKTVLEGDFKSNLLFFFPDEEPDDPAVDKGDIILYVAGGEDQFSLLKNSLLQSWKE